MSTKGIFRVHIQGHYDLEDQRIACPNCGTDRGLTFYARPVDTEAMVMCTFGCGYDWWDQRISGEVVHDMFLAHTGQPTRTTTIRIDGEPVPREPCGECEAIKTELNELGALASAADGDERKAMGARMAALLGAWCGHLAEAHLGESSPAKGA